MEPFEIEGAALDLYRRASIEPDRPVGPMRLARALPELDILFAIKGPKARYVANDNGRGVVHVRNDLAGSARSWFVAHELGHHASRMVRSQWAESIASAIGAAIIAPRPAMRVLRDAVGFDLEAMARALGTTQSIVSLRIGEVLDAQVAVVMPGRVKRRGHDTLPDDAELRKIVRAGGCRDARVIRLTDAKRAVVIGDY